MEQKEAFKLFISNCYYYLQTIQAITLEYGKNRGAENNRGGGGGST